MRSKNSMLGNYIKQVNNRNTDLRVTKLQGINMHKQFIDSVANTIGTDMSKYKIVRQGQFAYNPMHVGRDRLLPISLLTEDEEIIVSPAYTVFEIDKPDKLIPEYLMMWLFRPEFDRRSWFTTDNSIRGGFSWDSLCEMPVNFPTMDKQIIILLESLLEQEQILMAKKKRLMKKYLGPEKYEF